MNAKVTVHTSESPPGTLVRHRRPDGWHAAPTTVTCAKCGRTSTAPITEGWTRVVFDGADVWTCPKHRQPDSTSHDGSGNEDRP